MIPKLLSQNLRGRIQIVLSAATENCKFEKSYSPLLVEKNGAFQKVGYYRSIYFKMMLGVSNS